MTSDEFLIEFGDDHLESDEIVASGTWAATEGSNFARLLDTQERKFKRISSRPDVPLKSWKSEVHRVASRCIDPTADPAQTRSTCHLVVGRIQAGKTGNFTGLMALLADNTYPLFIVVAGTSRNLRDQTAARLAEDLGHFNFNFITTGEGPLGKRSITLQSEIERTLLDWQDAKDGRAPYPKPLCLTILKTTKGHLDLANGVLENLALTDSTANLLRKAPVLVVDDECDSASPNGNVNQPEADRAATNAALVRMRNSLPLHTYVGYTATPQAQVLMEIDDALKPDRVTSLDPGEDYLGVEHLFAGDSTFAHSVKKWDSTDNLPESLKIALGTFVLQSFLFHHPDADVRKRFISPPLLTGERSNESPVSMLVHVDRTVVLSRAVYVAMDNLRRQWERTLKLQPSSSGLMDGTQRIIYEKYLLPGIKAFGIETLADEPGFFRLLRDELIGTELRFVVSEDSGGDAYPSEQEFKTRRAWILVGAVLLDRGQTLPNLLNTYLARDSGGGAKGGEAGGNIDTLLQRGRFFGYRKQYLPLLRGYFSPTTLASYQEIANLEPIWRNALGRIDRADLALSDFPFLLELSTKSPKLGPVRKNIIPKSVDRVRSSGWFLRESWVSAERSDKNLRLLEKKIAGEWSAAFASDHEWVDKHFGFGISWDDAVRLIREWDFDIGDEESRGVTLDVLEYLAPEFGSDGVQVLLMNRKNLGKESSEPTYIRRVQRMSGNAFQTAGLLSYTDRKYVSEKRPTIQIHFLRVLGRDGSELVGTGVGLGFHAREISYVKTGGSRDE